MRRLGLVLAGMVLGWVLFPTVFAQVTQFGNLQGTNFNVNGVISPGVYVLNPTTGAPGGGTAAVGDAAAADQAVTFAGAVRDDALSTLSESDGDATLFRTDSTGSLWVHLSAAPELETPNGNAITDETADAMKALLVDSTGTALAFGEDYSHDEALTITVGASPSGPLMMGRASAAAPTNVTASNDAVPAWHLLNGAQAVNITAAGALIPGDATGGLFVQTIDPCSQEAKTFYVVDTATAGTLEIANAVASEFFYICSVNLVTNATNAVVIAEDDSDSCGSISAGVTGGTTAAEGWTFAANGGISIGNGLSTIAKTTTANRYLCLLSSASTQLSGTIGYVSDP